MIDILFFAQVRELVGTGALSMPADYPTVEALRQALCARGDRWALALESGKLLAAVNQSLVAADHPLRAGDEVAFFPAGYRGVSMENTRIRVGEAPFNVGDEYQWLAQCDADGAVVTFTGKVRNHNLGDDVSALTLEHYPGMTEKALAEIVAEARSRWPLQRVTVIHRVGALYPGDEIVFVGVTGAHRGMAFAASEFIMDYLKTRAPFWKREATGQGDRWVDARDSDRQAAQRWHDAAK